MLLSLVCLVKIIHQREVIENFAESVQCYGTIFVILKQGGGVHFKLKLQDIKKLFFILIFVKIKYNNYSI